MISTYLNMIKAPISQATVPEVTRYFGYTPYFNGMNFHDFPTFFFGWKMWTGPSGCPEFCRRNPTATWNLRTNLVELVAGKSRIQTWWHGVAFSLCQSCRRCFRRHGCVQKRRMGFPNIHIWQILVSRCIKTLIFSKFSSPNCRRSFGVLVADPPLFCYLRSWLQLISGCSLANASLCSPSASHQKSAKAAWTVTQPVAEDDPFEAGIFNGCT